MARLGVFYSIGFFIMMTVFLAFALVIVKEFNLFNERFSEDAGFERIHNIDESIQKGFRDIFSLTSGITIRKVENNFTFIERLPNPGSDNFKNNISEFKYFIESNYSVNFDVKAINDSLPLFIRPRGIEFSHPNYGGNDLNITYGQVNFDGFLLIITTDEVLDSGSCSSSGSSIDPYLNIEAYGSSGSCSSSGITDLELFDTNVPPNRLALVNLDGNMLAIQGNGGFIIVNLKIVNLDLINNSIIVTTQENVLQYNFEDFNYIKNGTIRVL